MKTAGTGAGPAMDWSPKPSWSPSSTARTLVYVGSTATVLLLLIGRSATTSSPDSRAQTRSGVRGGGSSRSSDTPGIFLTAADTDRAPPSFQAGSGGIAACLSARHLPASLRPLCPLLNAPLAPRLAQYYSTAVPAFKVHVQHLHPFGTSFEDTPCFAHFSRLCLGQPEGPSLVCPNSTTRGGRAPKKGKQSNSLYTGKFMAETLIPMGLKLSPQHTADPAEADVVLVSSCTVAYGREGSLAGRIVGHILEGPTAQRWKKAPADFVVIGTNDHGFCANSKERFEDTKSATGLEMPQKDPGWHDEKLKGATALLNEGSTQHRCFRSGIDVTIPTSQVVGNNPACPAAQNMTRSRLAFLAGKASSRLRWHLAKKFKDDPDFVVVDDEHRMSHAEYLCAMADSVFCLAPRGQAAWSPRLDEAIHAGCIPVIIANHCKDLDTPLARNPDVLLPCTDLGAAFFSLTDPCSTHRRTPPTVWLTRPCSLRSPSRRRRRAAVRQGTQLLGVLGPLQRVGNSAWPRDDEAQGDASGDSGGAAT